MKLCSAILFADDTSLYYTHGNMSHLYRTVNDELKIVVDWFRANKLSLNAGKTNCILFHSRYQNVEHNEVLFMDGQEILHKNHTKFLGLIVDELLEWNHHTDFLKSKLAQSLYIINASKNLLSKSCLKLLYYSLIYSGLNYGTMLWGTTYDYNLKDLQIKQNNCVRIIEKAKSRATADPLFKKLHILPIECITKLEMMKFMFKYTNNLLPVGLNTLFRANQQVHNYNTRQSQAPHTESHTYKIVADSFVRKGPEMEKVKA